MTTSPELIDRDLMRHDALAGVALFVKRSINYAVFDVFPDGEVDATTGEWFTIARKEAAIERYEARVAEAREFL